MAHEFVRSWLFMGMWGVPAVIFAVVVFRGTLKPFAALASGLALASPILIARWLY